MLAQGEGVGRTRHPRKRTHGGGLWIRRAAELSPHLALTGIPLSGARSASIAMGALRAESAPEQRQAAQAKAAPLGREMRTRGPRREENIVWPRPRRKGPTGS